MSDQAAGNALLFPGQGAQFVGMGEQLYEQLAEVRELFSRAEAVLGYDLAEVCFRGPAEALDSTRHSQPALYVTSIAACVRLKQERPEVVAAARAAAGLSLGEYSALAFAEAFDFETGLAVVRVRGEAMQAAADEHPSGMVSILGLDPERIEALCQEAAEGEVLQVANLLCPGNTVVSGTVAACERVRGLAEAAGAMKVIPLAVAGAFHTPLMQSAVGKLADVLAAAEIRSPRIPVVSNVDAAPHSDPEEIRDLLVRQVVSPVRWEASVRQLIRDGIQQYYEVGAGRVLRGLMRRIDKSCRCENIEA